MNNCIVWYQKQWLAIANNYTIIIVKVRHTGYKLCLFIHFIIPPHRHMSPTSGSSPSAAILQLNKKSKRNKLSIRCHVCSIYTCAWQLVSQQQRLVEFYVDHRMQSYPPVQSIWSSYEDCPLRPSYVANYEVYS